MMHSKRSETKLSIPFFREKLVKVGLLKNGTCVVSIRVPEIGTFRPQRVKHSMTKTWDLIAAPRGVVVIVFYFDYAP